MDSDHLTRGADERTADEGHGATAPTFHGAIDMPQERRSVAGLVEVLGWAFSTDAPIVRVEIFAGEIALATLPCGIARPDIAQRFSHRYAAISGYAGWVSFDAVPLGECRLVIHATDARGGRAVYTRTVIVVESPIHGALDTPDVGATVLQELWITGWAISTAAPIARVEAFMDEVELGAIHYGDDRPDVALLFARPEFGASGIAARVLLNTFPSGTKRLRIRIIDERGNRRELARALRLKQSIGHIWLDEPQEGDPTSGTLVVRGWAFSGAAPIVRVEAFLGPELLGPVSYGLVRSDVKEIVHHPNASNSGFHGKFRFPIHRLGPRVLTVRASDAEGGEVETTVTVRAVAPDDPFARVERATWERGVVRVEGWAIWSGDAFPCTARFFLEGTFLGEVRVNLSRPDIAVRFPNHPAAERCGFRFSRPFPSPTAMPDRPPELAIEFVDKAGRQLRCDTHLPFAFDTSLGAVSQLVEQFEQMLATCRGYLGEDPAILDWDTDLPFATLFPAMTILSPPTTDDPSRLPYTDASFAVVIVETGDPARLAEATRVAATMVIGVHELTPASAARHLNPGAGERTVKLDRLWCDLTVTKGDGASPPGVSIIIPVHNQAHYTQACLARLTATLPADFPTEIVVVDDASTDDTIVVLHRWASTDRRGRIVRNEENRGFLRSCNRGAEAASGEILVFLNNDTLPEPGWLPPLMRVLRDYPAAGAVGGKLIYPDGRLQEAGGVIFSDGSGYNFGKNDGDADAPLYAHVREVDYCSGALLATPRALFLDVGGFDARFAPAYYEDVDYAFVLRARGYRVLYQPESVAVHFEGVSSGTDLAAGAKRHQVTNQIAFVAKWREVLRDQPARPAHFDATTHRLLAVREQAGWRYNAKATKRALICAPRMPEFDREGGSQRIFHFIEFLREEGWAVSFIAHDATGGERYARILRQRGVAVYAGKDSLFVGSEYLPEADRLIATGRFDLAILPFWSIGAEYLPIIRLFSPETRVIVDSIDLHFLRNARRVFGRSDGGAIAGALDRDDTDQMMGELNTYAAADAVFTVSQKEADLVNDFLASEDTAHVIPLMEDLPRSTLPFAGRSGMVFIGNFRHPPNIEALEYLCGDILPLVDPALLAEHPVTVVGNRLETVIDTIKYRPDQVRMAGWVPSVVPYLQGARLSLIPLRHGAGTKTKLIQALMVGTPSVSTSVGVEGLDLRDGNEVLVADNPATFAAGITRLLADAVAWQHIAERGHAHIAVFHSREAVRTRFMAAINGALSKAPKQLALLSVGNVETDPTEDESL